MPALSTICNYPKRTKAITGLNSTIHENHIYPFSHGSILNGEPLYLFLPSKKEPFVSIPRTISCSFPIKASLPGTCNPTPPQFLDLITLLFHSHPPPPPRSALPLCPPSLSYSKLYCKVKPVRKGPNPTNYCMRASDFCLIL